MKKILQILPKSFFLFVFIVIIHCSLFITLCYAQPQWHIYTTTNSGLPDNGVSCVAIDTNGNKWIGTANGLAKFDGNNWTIFDTTNSPIPFGYIFNISVDKHNVLWLGSWLGGGLAKYDGINWTIFNTTNSGIPSNQIYSVAIDRNNVKWIGAGTKLAKFNDTIWTIYNTSDFGVPLNNFNTITISNNIKWFGMYSYGIIKYYDTGYVLYNTSNSQIPSDYINQIFIQQNGLVWVATEFGGLAKYNISSNQWIAYNTGNSGIGDNFLHAVIVSKNNFKWIGTFSTGLVRFNDTAFVHFNMSNSPLPDNSVQNISVDSVSNLWIATNGGLAEFNETGIIGIVNNGNHVPGDFILEQNFPNPFNPSTIISYELTKKSYIELNVYNLLGELIVNIIKQNQNAGKYKINFNGNNLPSGVYFYKLQAGDFIETKKMICLK